MYTYSSRRKEIFTLIQLIMQHLTLAERYGYKMTITFTCSIHDLQ